MYNHSYPNGHASAGPAGLWGAGAGVVGPQPGYSYAHPAAAGCGTPKKVGCGHPLDASGSCASGCQIQGVAVDPCTAETRVFYGHAAAAAPPQPPRSVYVQLPVTELPCSPRPARAPCQVPKKCPKESKPLCYVCGPKRANCYPGDPACYGKPEFVTDFRDYEVGIKGEMYNFMTMANRWVANDGSARASQSGLTIDSTRFNPDVTYTGSAGSNPATRWCDHYRYLSFINSVFTVPDCGQLYAEACMAAAVKNVTPHPYPDALVRDPESDLRLACSVFGMFSFEVGIFFGFAVTNDQIWAVYERMGERPDSDSVLQSNRSDGAKKFSFVSATPIARRKTECMDDFARLGIAYDRHKNSAVWYIDGVEHHRQTRVGTLPDKRHVILDSGGSVDVADIRCLTVGFGHAQYMDCVDPFHNLNEPYTNWGLIQLQDQTYYNPVNRRSNVPVRFYRPYDGTPLSEGPNFYGQGVATVIKGIKVENRC